MRPLNRHLYSTLFTLLIWGTAQVLLAQTPTFTNTNTPLPCGSSASNFGTIGGSYTGPATNVMRASEFSLNTPATVYNVTFYCENPSGGAQACAAIYSGTAGAIGSLIVQSTSQPLTNFTYATFSLPATPLNPGTYWLAYMVSGTTGVVTNSGVTTVLSTLMSSESVTFGTFPNSMMSPSYLSGHDFIYASYCPAATYTPTFTKTATPTSTWTSTFTATNSFTASNTFTSSYTPTATNTGTLFTSTFTDTNTPTITPTPTSTNSFTFTATVNASLTPPCPSPGTFGVTLPFGGYVTSASPPGYGLRGSRFNLSTPATVVSITLYGYDNPAPPHPTDIGDQAQVAIYQDSGDTMGNLITNSNAQTLVAGWNVFQIPTTFLSPGNYWLTYMYSAPSTYFVTYAGSTGVTTSPFTNVSAAVGWGSFPASGAPFTSYGGNMWDAIYASYCPAPTYTATPSNTPTGSATYTPTLTNTLTPTYTPTGSATATPTNTGTPTNTFTITNTGTNTDTPTWTGTPTDSPTPTNTGTNTSTPTVTWTPTNTGTSTFSFTPTWTGTPTFSPTATFTGTFTFTPTPTFSYTPSPTFTWTGTSTFTPTFSWTFTKTSTPTFSFTPTVTFTFTNSPTGTLSPSFTPTFTSSFTWTPTPTNSLTSTPTGTSTFTFSSTPSFTASFTATPSATSTGTSTFTPTWTGTPTFTVTPTPSPTSTMTPTPGVDIAKIVSESTAQRGDILTYTLALNVTGGGVGGVTVVDVLPNYLDFIGFGTVPLGGAYIWDPTTRTLVCAFSTIAPGAYGISYQAQVDAAAPPGTTLTNNVQLTYAGLAVAKTASVNVEVPLNVPVVFPNPLKGPGPTNLQVVFPETENFVTIKVFTTAFRKVYEDTIQSVPQGTFTYGLDPDHFKGSRAANGLYYAVISTPSHRWVLKILIEK